MNAALPPDSAVVANWSASDWLMSAELSEKPQLNQKDKQRGAVGSGIPV
jgi:hypothetical protein